MDDLARDILARHKELLHKRGAWEDRWEDVYDYVRPAKVGALKEGRGEGEANTDKQFDSTAPDASDTLGATISGLMTPQDEQWIRFTIGGLNGLDNEPPELRAFLDRAGDMLLRALQTSNFYQENAEVIQDQIDIGTANLLVDEVRPFTQPGFNGFRFRAINIGEFALAEDHQGRVDTIFREIEYSARQAVQKWGEKAGEDAWKAFTDRDATAADKTFKYLHAVFPREGGRKGSILAKDMPFAGVWVNVEAEEVIDESGFFELPYIVPRWSKLSGETYGRSVTMKAMPDIKTLNLINRYGLEALPLELYPPWLVNSETFEDTLDLSAGATNYWDGKEDQRPMPLTTQRNAAFEVAVREYYEDRVRAYYFADRLKLRNSPQMTATEVLERQEEMLRILHPTVGRMAREYLDPLIHRCFMMLLRSGALGAPPPQFKDLFAQGGSVDIEYLSPLARAQRMHDIRSADVWLARVEQLAKFNPAVIDIVETDVLARKSGERLGVDAAFMRDKDTVAAARQTRAQAQAATQEFERGLQVADRAVAAGKVEPQQSAGT